VTFLWHVVIDTCTLTGAITLAALALAFAALAREFVRPRQQPRRVRRRDRAGVVAEAEELLRDAAR
jgi:hypothetical protein